MRQKRIATKDEVLAHIRDFDPKYMSQDEVRRAMTELSSQGKHIWYTGKLEERPPQSQGLVICKHCGELYWVAPHVRDATRSVEGGNQEIEGPFCDPCSYIALRKVEKK